jgi:tetratricopeptide (TPR) repeat protein
MNHLNYPHLRQRLVSKLGAVSGALVILLLSSIAFAGPRDAAWKQVEEAATKGLPKTAIERLEPIITGALADKSYAEAAKAIARRIVLEGEVQGGKPEEMIVRMQAELEKAPAPMKPVMEALLAHQVWQYFQQNRWRFQQRTQTTVAPGPDIQSWDLARILAEIDRHFTAALADEAVLKASPIGDWDDLIEKGSVPDAYRPTLFDFLAYDALQFYQAGEHGAVAAEDAFGLDTAGPIFGNVAAFTRWHPESREGNSPTLKAIRLYQALLEFHRNDADRSAFLDADLARLEFGGNSAQGEAREDRYQAVLNRFIEAARAHEVSSRALAMLAARLDNEGERTEAHKLARRGYEAFPASAGGAMCFNLIQRIEARSARLETERVWNAPWPTLNLTYRNVTKVYFRAVAVDYPRYIEQLNWESGRSSREVVDQLLTKEPALAWDAPLPATADFKERTERLPAPTSLKPGFYFIVASHEPTFRELGGQVGFTTVWVSDLALVTRTRADGLPQGGLVLKANTGEPVAGATHAQGLV